MADPEPGRCRRTDGKKWRCYKNVVEDQKYCERHMHRGRRQRSRKLVEDLGNIPKSCLIANTNTLLSATAKYQFALPASGTGKSTPSMVNLCSISRKTVNVNNHHSSLFPTTASIKADANCGNPSGDLRNGSETQIQSEAMRCKRTDGKQWRCSHIVVDGAKYCEKHMHRGAKKVTRISNPLVVAAADPSGGSDNPFYIAKREKSFINLNVDPSSIVACGMTVNDVSQPTKSSGSSDDTTISID